MAQFYKKLNAIAAIAAPALKSELMRACTFWNAENRNEKLSDLINSHVIMDSDNINSIKIYSILLEKSEDEIIEMFDSDDLK